MTRRFPFRIMAIVLSLLVVSSVINAIATSNIMSGSNNLDEQSRVITLNDKKPPQCTMNLVRVVTCTGGNCNGTGQNELILGTSNEERIRGFGGQDCILGGDGNDEIIGNKGGDVCIGGPGDDTFTSCEIIIDP